MNYRELQELYNSLPDPTGILGELAWTSSTRPFVVKAEASGFGPIHFKLTETNDFWPHLGRFLERAAPQSKATFLHLMAGWAARTNAPAEHNLDLAFHGEGSLWWTARGTVLRLTGEANGSGDWSGDEYQTVEHATRGERCLDNWSYRSSGVWGRASSEYNTPNMYDLVCPVDTTVTFLKPVTPTVIKEYVMSPELRAKLEPFATADLTKAVDLVRCGFEFETHKSGEYDRNNANDKALALAGAKAKETLAADMMDPKAVARCYPAFCSLLATVPEGVKREQLQALLGLTDLEKAADYFGDVMKDAKARFAAERQREYERLRYRLLFPTLPEYLDVGEDGSVTGFEFRCAKGGVTTEQFSDALQKLTAIPHQIKTNCSFHIHLSVNGLTHNYGPEVQRAMYEYLLLKAWDRVPAKVKTRWNDYGSRGQFFSAIVNQPQDVEKMRFVAFRGKTWEFRCFGNVGTYEDGMTCLQLAIEAMQHAYKVKLGLEKIMFPGAIDYNGLCDVAHRAAWLDKQAKYADAA